MTKAEETTKEEVMSESEGAYYYSSFSCWEKLWNILEEIIKRFKTVIGSMGFASQSQDGAQPQTKQSIEEEDVVEEQELVETTTSTSRSILGGSIMMLRAPPRRPVTRGRGAQTN